MIGRRSLVGAVVAVTIIISACNGSGSAGSGSVPATAAPTAIDAPTAAASASVQPAASPSPELTTHRLTLDPGGPATLPPILVTAPGDWINDGGWAIRLDDPAGNVLAAVTFWDVDEVYGHPCQWRGTLFDPGPGVDELADALAGIPLRDATPVTAVTVDGYDGRLLEWSVPADMEFDECDADSGTSYFESWTARGWSTDRYQQGPGQIDRLWILDVDGTRLVIDAFIMPSATDAQRQQLEDVVASIRFEG